jgi:hypothetical protein
LVKWIGYPDSDNTWESAKHIHAPDLIKSYQKQHQLSIKTLWTMVEARCALSLKRLQPNRNSSPQRPPPSGSSRSSFNPIYSPGNSSSCGSTINPWTMPWYTRTVTGSWNEASLYASWTRVSSGTGQKGICLIASLYDLIDGCAHG